MPAAIDVYRVLCRGGLNTNEDTLFISDNFPGQASALINYEVSQFGGYRRIDGHAPFDTAAGVVPGTGAILGVALSDGNLYAARQTTGSANYEVFLRATGDWGSAINTGDTRVATGVSRVRVTEEVFSGVKRPIFTDGVNMPAVITGGAWKVLASTGSSAVSGASYSTIHQGHTWYAGIAGRENILVCTAPATYDDFHAANGAAEFTISFPIKGIKSWRENLYIFGEKNIRKLTGRTTDDFVIDDVTTQLGLIAPDTLIELQGDLIFLSQDGFRTIAGTDRIGDVDLETISEDIKSLLIELPSQTTLTDLVSVPITRKSQFRMFVYDADVSASSAEGFIGGVRYTKGGPKAWEFGQLLGIQANCAHTDFISGVETTVIGDADGNVHKIEQGPSFNGANIISIYTTPYWDVGNSESEKEFLREHIFMRSEGTSAGITLGMTLDWGDPTKTDIADAVGTLAARSAIYDDPLILWDASGLVWDAQGRPTVKYNLGGNGYSASFTLFNSSATTDPFSVQGWSIRYTDKGVQ